MTDNLNDVLQELSALLHRISEQDPQHRVEQYKPKVEEAHPNPMKSGLQSLEHHSQLLESLIARLKESPKKG